MSLSTISLKTISKEDQRCAIEGLPTWLLEGLQTWWSYRLDNTVNENFVNGYLHGLNMAKISPEVSDELLTLLYVSYEMRDIENESIPTDDRD